jgi:hypothetical protein
MTVNYQADDRIQTVKCMSFEDNTCNNEGVQGGSNPPLWDSVYLNFQNKKKKYGSVVKMEYLVGDLNYTILDCNI